MGADTRSEEEKEEIAGTVEDKLKNLEGTWSKRKIEKA